MAKQLENFTIYQILHYSAILQDIARCPMLTAPFYRSIFNDCAEDYGFYHKVGTLHPQNAYMGTDDWRPSFDCLVKYGFIEVIDIETYILYVKLNEWGYPTNEIIEMTDEQYEKLPEFFQKQVTTQLRKRYLYKLNLQKVDEIVALAEFLRNFFN